jgi:hypothetical protein
MTIVRRSVGWSISATRLAHIKIWSLGIQWQSQKRNTVTIGIPTGVSQFPRRGNIRGQYLKQSSGRSSVKQGQKFCKLHQHQNFSFQASANSQSHFSRSHWPSHSDVLLRITCCLASGVIDISQSAFLLMSLNSNPHFDRNMVGVKIALIVELGATILSTSFAIYCLLFQAPAPLSRTFRAIMAFQMIVSVFKRSEAIQFQIARISCLCCHPINASRLSALSDNLVWWTFQIIKCTSLRSCRIRLNFRFM